MAEEKLFDLVHHQPLLVVISGTSAAGKDSVIKRLKRRKHAFHFVVTVTNRTPRRNEIPGKDYIFVTTEVFERMRRDGEFLECADVYGEKKGVLKQQVREAFASGKDVFMRVDVQGAERLHQLYPQAVLIFLVPKDLEEMKRRLEKRGDITPENMEMRIEKARVEVKQARWFDYVVKNPDGFLGETTDTLVSIIRAEHQRTHHREVIV